MKKVQLGFMRLTAAVIALFAACASAWTAHGASFVPVGGDLASQTATDWNPEAVPTSATAVSIPNAGTYWASSDVTFNTLTFSAAGETVVDQHAKGYDNVTVTAKGGTWALNQTANGSVVRLKGGVWDFSGKHTKLGQDDYNRSGCGIIIDDGAAVRVGDWRGSVHWSSSTQMLDNASTVTASGTGYFIYDRGNKKYSQNNRFIVAGGSVFTSNGFVTYNWAKTYTETHVDGNEILVTGEGSKMVMSNSGTFTIGFASQGDFTVRLEDGGDISGGNVRFGSSNNKLIVDGGKLSSTFKFVSTNNFASIANVADMTLRLPSSSDYDPMGGSYNTLQISNALVRTSTTYLFNSGHHNTLNVKNGATWDIDSELFLDISRDKVTSNNVIRIDDGGSVSVGFARLSGDQNEIVVSNGTFNLKKPNNNYGLCLNFRDYSSAKNVLRLQGSHPRVTKGDGTVVFLANSGSEVSFELPAEGYDEGPVIDMGRITINSGASIKIDCRECQRAMTKARVSRKTFTLARSFSGEMSINNSVLTAANASIDADCPDRCRVYVANNELLLEVKSKPLGLILSVL